MLRGIRGTYLYVCDENLREYFSQFIPRFKVRKQTIIVNSDEVIPYVNSVPLYDLKVAAGIFSELQTATDCVWVKLPKHYNPSSDLFACEIIGDSMNKIIPNGSICLFKKYSAGSRDGKTVLVELTNLQDPDSGSRYTVKEYRSIKNITEDSWAHESIILKPFSYDSKYEDILLKEDELNNLKIIGIFECVL